MIRTQVYIPYDVYRDLQLLSASTKKNISQLIREGARELIMMEAKKRVQEIDPWENFIGAIKGVKTNAVKDIHDYYENGAI
jgi:hypothetical protein